MTTTSSHRSTPAQESDLLNAIHSDVFESISTKPSRTMKSASDSLNEPMMEAVRTLLLGVGEDPEREGLLKTHH